MRTGCEPSTVECDDGGCVSGSWFPYTLLYIVQPGDLTDMRNTKFFVDRCSPDSDEYEMPSSLGLTIRRSHITATGFEMTAALMVVADGALGEYECILTGVIIWGNVCRSV